MNDTDAPEESYTGVPAPTSRSGITGRRALPVALSVTESSALSERFPSVERVLLPARFPRL